jgi:hypothetical protein
LLIRLKLILITYIQELIDFYFFSDAGKLCAFVLLVAGINYTQIPFTDDWLFTELKDSYLPCYHGGGPDALLKGSATGSVCPGKFQLAPSPCLQLQFNRTAQVMMRSLDVLLIMNESGNGPTL